MTAIKLVIFIVLGCLASTPESYAQSTPFSANWSFEGNLNGTSSTPLVTANAATLSNILVPNVGGYPAGQVGKTVNLQNWSDPACPGNEYLEITVSPASTVTVVMTSLSFYFSHSDKGPKGIKVKHSIDGFTADIYTSPITTTNAPYQFASIDLASLSPAYMTQTQPISFRIYGCNRESVNGSMRIDEIMINATALPIGFDVTSTSSLPGLRKQLK